MRPALLSFFLLLAGLVLPRSAYATLKVVTTTSDLAAIAQEVGQDRIKVTALALASQDPHFVDARPNLALQLSKADLLLVVGLDLEIGWLPVLQSGSRNPAIQKGSKGYLDCSTLVRLLEVPTTQIDRSMGDIHPGGNPHYLYDPRNAVSLSLGLARKFGELDPHNAAAYTAAAQDFIRRLGEARTGWEAALAPLKGAPTVGFHKSFPYLADWVGLDMIEHIEPKPGIPPAPSHVAHVLDVMRQRNVKLIIQEAYYGDPTGKDLGGRTGAHLALIPGGTDFAGGETFIQHTQKVVDTLLKGGKP